jgi:hypothetical protein
MQSIPPTLAPFFQEYDIARLNPATDSFTIIERTLQFGNREEIRWLFRTDSREQVADWVRRFGTDRLPQPHLNFWQIILELTSLALQIGHRYSVDLDFFSTTLTGACDMAGSKGLLHPTGKRVWAQVAAVMVSTAGLDLLR